MKLHLLNEALSLVLVNVFFCLLCVLDTLPSDPVQQQYNFWMSLVDKLGVKAFVDLTLSPTVRQGTQHLLRITGLGKLIFVSSLFFSVQSVTLLYVLTPTFL